MRLLFSPSELLQQAQKLLGYLLNPAVGAITLFLCSLFLMLIIGNPMINWLKAKRWKKGTTLDETWAVREDTPDSHQLKQGTPSMGGIGIIVATLLSCGAFLSAMLALSRIHRMSWPFNWVETFCFLLLPLVFLSHGVLGFVDDWSKASGRGGLKARSKFAGQLVLSFTFVLLVPNLAAALIAQPNLSEIAIPAYSYSSTGIICFLALALIATCNAVNLTDGIDGLATGLAVQCGIVLFFIPYSTYSPFGIEFFCLALVGACLGFLKFNKYKARVFMGDTGSLAVGAALGAGAILQGAVFLLPFIGFIYFVEMFSVIFQVAWFKWTKRKTGEGQRLFRRAPLHHHFELAGWSEWRVVGTFWAINLFTSAIGLWLWHAGVLPRWP